MVTVPVNAAVKPLEWLLGKWTADVGKAIYPTMKDFTYHEELEFTHVGQPNLCYSLNTWNPETKAPMHRESGFLRIQPETNKVAFLTAHNLGITELSEGEVNGQELKLQSTNICRMSFAKEPATQKIHRTFTRSGDELVQIVLMETDKTPLTKHLEVRYKKAS